MVFERSGKMCEQLELPIFNYTENLTNDQKKILKKGLKESELLTDIGDRMEEDIKHILSSN